MTSLPAWMDHGACKGKNQAIFFPQRQRGERAARTTTVDEIAKDICSSCPVIDECLNWALTRPEMTGTWGGMTDIERRVILGCDIDGRRKAGSPTCGTNRGYNKHRQQHHEPCEPCLQAQRDYMAEWARNKRATA